MSRKFPTVKAQEQALDEIRRVLNRDMKVMTSDYSIEEATPELLERVVLFDGILSMFDILEEKVTAGVLLASKVIHYNANDTARAALEGDLVEQAEACLTLMVGKKGE